LLNDLTNTSGAVIRSADTFHMTSAVPVLSWSDNVLHLRRKCFFKLLQHR